MGSTGVLRTLRLNFFKFSLATGSSILFATTIRVVFINTELIEARGISHPFNRRRERRVVARTSPFLAGMWLTRQGERVCRPARINASGEAFGLRFRGPEYPRP